MKGWICISSKRLKLYDTSIEICVNKKTKEKLRKVAYKQKITMSEYIRQLIELAIINNEINDFENKKILSTKNVDKALTLLGGISND